MATLQGGFHYPYVPDEEIELGKGQIIVHGNFYRAARKRSWVWNAFDGTLTGSLVVLLVNDPYLLSFTNSEKLDSSPVCLPLQDQKRRSLDSRVWS